MNKNNIFYVYVLRRPDNHDPFYKWKSQPFWVGKGKGRRKGCHLREARLYLKTGHSYNPVKDNIILFLIKNGLFFETEIIYDNLKEDEAKALEIKLISFYGKVKDGSGILCNQADGGGGCSGFRHSEQTKINLSIINTGKKHSKETINKLRINQIARLLFPHNHPMYGKHHTEESNQKNRESHIGKCFLTDEGRKRKSEFMKEYNKQKKIDECGHEDWLRCSYCKKYDKPENLFVNNGRSYHRKCRLEYQRKRRRIESENKNKIRLEKIENGSYGNKKLKVDDIREIRLLISNGVHFTEIAKNFNVNLCTIYSIYNGKTWAWVED